MSLAEIVKAHEWDNDIYLASNTPPPLIHEHRAALIQMVRECRPFVEQCPALIKIEGSVMLPRELAEHADLLKRVEEI